MSYENSQELKWYETIGFPVKSWQCLCSAEMVGMHKMQKTGEIDVFLLELLSNIYFYC
jgi:hypothetical protein